MSPRKSPDIIAIASDHAGFQLKSELKKDLEDSGFAVLDLGTDDHDHFISPEERLRIAMARQ